MTYFLAYVSIVISILLILTLFILFGWRWIMKRMVKQIGKIILTDDYQENIIELLPGLRHMGIQNMLENSLRAETGEVLHRPIGSSKKWPHLDPITFIPAQTTPLLIDIEEEVDMQVTIGPKTKKPMEIKTPLMISGMAYGIALSEQVRLALAEAAGKYVLQFAKTEWSKEDELIKRADMIEIKFGQGSLFWIGAKIKPENLTGRAREIMGLEEDEVAVIYDNFFEDQTKEDLKGLVEELREFTGGVPIGVKMGAGGKLEEDLDYVLSLGIDFITIDGGQAATLGAAPILADDMGIPTLHAVVRAVDHLEKRNMKEQISLIVSGGLLVPGHFLKVLELGADAINLGSAILFTVAHTQTLNALPFEPPTQAVWNQGKHKDKFKIEDGVKSTEKFLTSSTEEMKTALRAMGKRSLKELSKQDLVSYDYLTSKMVGIPFSFEPWEDKSNKK